MLLTARAADGSPLTDTEIGDEVATFMLAGHETSANTLSWSLALLSAYPSARRTFTPRPVRGLPMRLLRRR